MAEGEAAAERESEVIETSPAVIAPGRRLGKAAPKYDVRTLRLASYIEKRKLPKVPTAHNLSRKTLKADRKSVV